MKSLAMAAHSSEEIKPQCSVQAGEEYIFELIIHGKNSKYDQLICSLTAGVFYVQVSSCAVGRHIHIWVIRLLFST